MIDRSKIGKKSKHKGDNYERSLCNRLSVWLCGEKGMFRRTPMSGGWDKKSKSSKDSQGDIIVPDGFPYIIECKNRESWSFKKLMETENPELLVWWDEINKLASMKNKSPLLIFTKNHHKDYIMMNDLTLSYFRLWGFKGRSLDFHRNHDHVSIALLDDVLCEGVKIGITDTFLSKSKDIK